jgi:hypothetical protein
MRTTHVNENLIQLTRLHFVNAYLVREDGGFTLVDTTTGGGHRVSSGGYLSGCDFATSPA